MAPNARPIAYQEYTSSTENLPLPVVLYPGGYGSIFGFKKDNTAEEIYLCTCAREAIRNHIYSRSLPVTADRSHQWYQFPLDTRTFSKFLIDGLSKIGQVNSQNVFDHLLFQDAICHECNKVTPLYRYCHEMYGGTFVQNYGWYVNKQFLEYGIGVLKLESLKRTCPSDILDFLEIDPTIYFEWLLFVKKNFPQAAQEIEERYRQQQKHVRILIENKVRQKFGYKPIGEAWTNETTLFHLVRRIYPKLNVVHHYRPDFLQGMEFDIWIEGLNVAIEYQGIQHYQPMPHWGGETAFAKLRRRDESKKEICDSRDILLICFRYDENLTEELVASKLDSQIASRTSQKKSP